jgi:hypothetical protein
MVSEVKDVGKKEKEREGDEETEDIRKRDCRPARDKPAGQQASASQRQGRDKAEAGFGEEVRQHLPSNETLSQPVQPGQPGQPA